MRLLRGYKRDYAPMSPISLKGKSSEILERFMRVLSGDKRDYAPKSPI